MLVMPVNGGVHMHSTAETMVISLVPTLTGNTTQVHVRRVFSPNIPCLIKTMAYQSPDLDCTLPPPGV
jgi:hypothetical protein